MATSTRSRPAKGPSRPWPILAAVALAAVVLAVVFWATGRSGEQVVGASELSHVHGLGINPDDGQLYVATHYGVFQLDGDDVRQVSDQTHDFMGFTVVGPDHFQASGHPSPADDSLRRDGLPPLLGLIESTDGGRTWESLSLLGEVDFHALTAAHGQVYGFDSTTGRFMVSSDGVNWDTRSQLPMADFAVDPADPDRIIATTADGAAESVDGGRTWEVSDGPVLVFLDWHGERGLWGLTSDAAVYEQTSGGWEQRGQLRGRPEALLVHDDGLFAAAHDGTTIIHRSTDGQNWKPVIGEAS